MIERDAHPATVALADLRMWMRDESAITPERALACIRTIAVELHDRRNWWPPAAAWTAIVFAAVCGAAWVIVALLAGYGGHP